MRFRTFVRLFIVGVALIPGTATASEPPKTLRKEFHAAAFVAYGKLLRTQHADIRSQESSFQTHVVLKGHPLLKGDAFDVDWCGDECRHYVLFLDHNLRVRRACPASRAALEYLKTIIARPDSNEVDRLEFLFQYIDTDDWTIAEDVLEELSTANNLHLNFLAQRLLAGPLRASLDIHRGRSRRDYITHCGGFPYHGLHASVLADLLSRRRDPQDAALLKGLVHDERFYGQTGMLISYIRLDPESGMKTLTEWADADRTDPNLPYRLHVAVDNGALLRRRAPYLCACFRQTVVARLFLKEKTAAAWFRQLYLLKDWDQTKEGLAFAEAHPNLDEDAWNEILCFALRNPERSAREFLDRQRRSNPGRLAAVEELLQLLEPVQDERGR